MKLLDQYREMHEAGCFPGYTIIKFADQIAEMVKKHDAKSLLDWGSGKAMAYQDQRIHNRWGAIMPRCYDPAVPRLSDLPTRKYDGLLCVDVLEHVPEDELDRDLRYMLNRATKFAFFTVCPRAAKKTLPNGTNCHVTIKPLDWWREKIATHNRGAIDVRLEENP